MPRFFLILSMLAVFLCMPMSALIAENLTGAFPDEDDSARDFSMWCEDHREDQCLVFLVTHRAAIYRYLLDKEKREVFCLPNPQDGEKLVKIVLKTIRDDRELGSKRISDALQVIYAASFPCR